MLNDPSTSGQPSATLFSSCFSALYGLADRVARCPSLMRTSRKMAAPHCPRPFWLGTLKYYADRIAAGYLRARFASITLYTLGLSAISDIALMRIVAGDTARLGWNFVFEESSFGRYPKGRLSSFVGIFQWCFTISSGLKDWCHNIIIITSSRTS